jgi:hypothetical protein
VPAHQDPLVDDRRASPVVLPVQTGVVVTATAPITNRMCGG